MRAVSSIHYRWTGYKNKSKPYSWIFTVINSLMEWLVIARSIYKNKVIDEINI